ncbi:MAG: hypothetical protein ACI8R4_000693 [Paracoccaceae bacterium]|jgi:hypothetical protein
MPPSQSLRAVGTVSRARPVPWCPIKRTGQGADCRAVNPASLRDIAVLQSQTAKHPGQGLGDVFGDQAGAKLNRAFHMQPGGGFGGGHRG